MIEKIALDFVTAINEHNPNKIIALMSDDHVFIDAYGNIENKTEMMHGWPNYFLWFPDYLIEINEIFISVDTVILIGYASGTYQGKRNPENSNYWRIPAAWRVVVKDDLVQVWQVFADSKIPYDIMEQHNND